MYKSADLMRLNRSGFGSILQVDLRRDRSRKSQR